MSVLTILLSLACGFIQPLDAWVDPSPHRVTHVLVRPGDQLEGLDWGGSGAAPVFLAGYDNDGAPARRSIAEAALRAPDVGTGLNVASPDDCDLPTMTLRRGNAQ